MQSLLFMDVFLIGVFIFLIIVVCCYWFLNYMEVILGGTSTSPDDRRPPVIELVHIHTLSSLNNHDHNMFDEQQEHVQVQAQPYDRVVINSPDAARPNNNNNSHGHGRTNNLRQSVRNLITRELANEDYADIDAGAAMVAF